MPSVVVLCRRPDHLSAEEASAWLAGELRQLAGGASRVEVVELRAPSRRFPSPWSWAIRMHVPDGADAARLLESPPCDELLADLRLLGMDPTVVAPVDGEVLP